MKFFKADHHFSITLGDYLELPFIQPDRLNVEGDRKQRPHSKIEDPLVPLTFDILVSNEVVEGALVTIHNQVIAMLSRKRNRLLSPPKDYVVKGVFKRRQFHHSASIAPMIVAVKCFLTKSRLRGFL